ncbi:zinc-binding dehydrogenase [Streptosporangium sp. NBC_01639]|uniref:zinc-binding dehydrogenase n=1 Tax=Streptosporangium sp. NBC_01639 TaxID=2975948 RepID=UPI00386E6C08|nr:zinc-binding dehydrogenase [Streptosporangium sp. NBC_01639]
MRATFMYGAGDVRIEQIPDPVLQEPTDALVRVVRSCVCGSDLHPYHAMPATAEGSPMGHEFGATDVVAERGQEGIAEVRELTGGHGAAKVLEAVGHLPAYEQAFGIVRPGGVISRVGVPQYDEAPVGFASLFGPNITLTGGPAPVRAYIEELLPGVLEGTVQPGKVFDLTMDLDEVTGAYRAMDRREALKVLIRP